MTTMPTMRHNITTAFFCDFFLVMSFVKIGTTNQMTNPIIMETMFIRYKDMGEEALL